MTAVFWGKRGVLQEPLLFRRQRQLFADPVFDHRPREHVQGLPRLLAPPGFVLARSDRGHPLGLGLLLLGPQEHVAD